MRLKGKLVNWNNDKAYGFVRPNVEGKDVFIHKAAFNNRQRIPQVNDVITFSIGKDKSGRFSAKEATFSGEKLIAKQPQKMSKFSVYLSVMFLCMVVSASFLEHIPIKLAQIYLGVSLITFLIYAIDKSKAKRNAWRIPENTLHLFALGGGWPGAAIAQQTFRHKSQKKEFRFVFWLTVVANCVALAWLASSNGQSLMTLFS